MKKVLLAVVILIISGVGAIAQYVPNSNQPFHYASLYNPAFTGIEGFNELKLGHRYQWSSFSEAPRSTFFAFNTRVKQPLDLTSNSIRISNIEELKKVNRSSIWKRSIMGLGANAFLETAGPLETTGGSLNYAIHLPLTERTFLAAGLAGVYANTRLRMDQITVHDPERDQFYQELLASGSSFSTLNIRTGFLLYSPTFYAGFSYLPLVYSTSAVNDVSTVAEENLGVIHAGFSFYVSPKTVVRPSVVGVFSGLDGLLMDYSVKVYAGNKIWSGVTYRDIEAAALMIGFYANEQFVFSYSYEASLGAFKQFNDGSHELSIGFRFNNPTSAPYYKW